MDIYNIDIDIDMIILYTDIEIITYKIVLCVFQNWLKSKKGILKKILIGNGWLNSSLP